MPPFIRRKPALGAGGRGMLPAVRKAGLPARQMPRQGPMQKARQMQRPGSMQGGRPRASHLSRGPTEPRLSPAQRTGWSRIPGVGAIIDFFVNLVFRGQRFRTFKRAPAGSAVRSLISVQMGVLNKGKRPIFSTTKERTPVMAVKGHQFLTKRKLHGVPRTGREKAAA